LHDCIQYIWCIWTHSNSGGGISSSFFSKSFSVVAISVFFSIRVLLLQTKDPIQTK
jgi:hypothetical protein